MNNIYYTDYPIKELGDLPYTICPLRPLEIVSYDGDKYCQVNIIHEDGQRYLTEIKAGYIYKTIPQEELKQYE